MLGFDGQPIAAAFDVKTASTLDTATINRLIDLAGDPDPETLRLAISTTPDGANPIASSDLTAQVEQAGARGGSFTFKFDPVALQPGTYFALLTSVSGAPLQAESSTIATEAWDEGVPVRVDGRDGYSIYHGVEIQRQWEDNAEKLDQYGGVARSERLRDDEQQSRLWFHVAPAAALSADLGILSEHVHGRTGLQVDRLVRVLSDAGAVHVPRSGNDASPGPVARSHALPAGGRVHLPRFDQRAAAARRRSLQRVRSSARAGV